MTIYFKFDHGDVDHDHCVRQEKVLSNLLLKKHYFNLDNLNILLQFGNYDGMDIASLDWGFKILRKHCKSLKDQFKSLNIGWKIIYNRGQVSRCYVLRWNSTINRKWLDEYQTKCKQNDQSTNECNENMQKYNHCRTKLTHMHIV